MMRYSLTCGLLLLLSTCNAEEALWLAENCLVRFASIEEGRSILEASDAFTKRLSTFDVQSRLKDPKLKTAKDYSAAIAESVREFDAEQVPRLRTAISELYTRLQPYRLPLPEEILLVCTTGKAEANAPHTRANAIVLPAERLAKQRDLTQLLAHELFHILSRLNPDWRDRLYAEIGYRKCNEITLPSSLRDLQLTNPDAPVIQHFIEIRSGDERLPVTQMLLANVPRYVPGDSRPFFKYLRVLYVQLERKGDEFVPRTNDDGELLALEKAELADFYAQVGRNTGYVIHPEEIMADNFALLINRKQVKSPEVLERIAKVLARS